MNNNLRSKVIADAANQVTEQHTESIKRQLALLEKLDDANEPLKEGYEGDLNNTMSEGVQPAPAVAADPAMAIGRKLISPLYDRKEVTFVHLGALYEVCELPFDLLAQFCAEKKYDRTTIQDVVLEAQLVGGMTDWGTILQIVPTIWAESLNQWLLIQRFVRRRADGTIGVWWMPRRERIRLTDPVLAGHSVVDTSKTIDVHFYLPYGNLGRVNLVIDNLLPTIAFDNTVKPPEDTLPEELVWQR